MKTVAQLRRENYKVRVSHFRWYLADEENEIWDLCPKYEALGKGYDVSSPDVKGGRTVIELTTPDGRSVTTYSECSDSDGFRKSTGVKVALKRAFIQLKLYDLIRD